MRMNSANSRKSVTQTIGGMRAKEARSLAVAGADTGATWNPQSPQLGLSRLWPSAIAKDSIELTDEPYASSAMLADDLRSRGATLNTIPYPYYRSNMYQGNPRLLDNSDWLTGKRPVYGTLETVNAVRKELADLVKRMIAYYEDQAESSYVARCELEDLPKICAQQWKRPGWYLDSPVTEADVPQTLPPEAVFAMTQVCARYARSADPEYFSKDWRSLTKLDFDPPDTMTGSPTYAAGEKTHQARLVTLAAFPAPDCSPEEWVNKVKVLQDTLGLPDPVLISPVVATRLGPRVKPMRLWYGEGAFKESTQSATGAYCRVRYVYPAPYPLNYVWSALYKQLATTRMRIPGLWHDPARQEEYIDRLRKQGKQPYAIDFSGMDTAMWPSIIMQIVISLLKAGYTSWPLEMMKVIYPQMGVIFPSLEGETTDSTIITGKVRPWCSGFKLTSEFDTIYGMSVLLSVLERQIPGTIQKWSSGEMTIAELGDDIIFTTNTAIDKDRATKDALELWGATLKIQEDVMFLKWILPLVPEIKVKTRPFARFIQQTFYNEDKYEGTEGGDKPECIMRIALKARMIGLKDHPDYNRWWPEIKTILMRLPYVAQGGPEYMRDVLEGESLALPRDVTDAQLLAMKDSTYFIKLLERSKYEPSAAALVALWQEMGITIDDTPSLEVRKLYDAALWRKPTEKDVSDLMSMISVR